MRSHPDSIRVLHVDDEPDFAALAAEFLERQDDRVVVETAMSAGEALDRVLETDFDCVVSDYDMPAQNGIELLEAVREEDPDLPFILYTGKGSEEVASEAISAGVTDYLQKEAGTSQYELLFNRIENAVEQRRSRAAATETERRLQTIAENTNDVLWKFTADWDELLFVNSPYEEIWGRPIDELREHPQSFLEGIHPQDRERVEDAMDRLTNGESVDIEYRVNADADFGRWVWVQGEPVFDDSGAVAQVVGFARDITDRKERQWELRDLERFNRELVENAPVGLFRLDEQMRIIYENPQAEAIVGVPEDEEGSPALGRDLRDLPSVQETDTVEALNRLEAGEPVTFETSFVSILGKESYLTGQGVPLFEDGEFDGAIIMVVDITERKRREQELQEKQAELRLYERAFEGATDLLAAADTEYNLLFANERYREHHGLTTADVGAVSLPEFLGDVWGDEVRPRVDRAIGGEVVRYEMERTGPDGDPRTLDIRYYPLTGGDGAIIGAVTAMRDVTESRSHERELERQANRLEAFTAAFPDLAFLVAADGRLLDFIAGKQSETLLYEDPEAFLGQRVHEVLPEAVADEIVPLVRTAIDTGETRQHVYTLDLPQGERRFEALIEGLPFQIDGHDAAVLVARDITDRLERERELERYETMVEATGDAMYTRDESGRFTYVNDAFVELTGYDEADLVGEPVSMVMDRSDVERGEQFIRGLLSSSDRRGTLEMDLVTAGGDRIPTENHVALLPFDDAFRGTVGVVRDITERVERERTLDERTRYLEGVLDSVEAAIWIRDIDHRFLLINQNFRDLFSLDDDTDVIGTLPSDFLPQAVADQFRANDERVLQSEEPVELEEDVQTSADQRTYLTRIIPLFNANDEVYATCGIAFDITEIREREAEIQRERDRLDEFVGVVSHDLRNPLGVAQGRLELARETHESEHLDAVARAHDRMEALIQDLLTLAREGGDVSDVETIDLEALAARCWEGVMTDSATLDNRTNRTVRADRGRLKQLLENLIRNAIEHGGADVTITIGDLDDGFYVEDDGPGVPASERDDVFEAGYSTSTDGTGFGLSIVRGIAEAHGWSVRLIDGAAGGARFEISGVEADR